MAKASLDKVNHIAIAVKDVAGAVAWYKNTFQCAVEYQDETWAYLQFENIHLALVVPNEHPQHIAFAVANAARFGTLKTHRDGTKSLYIEDPDGNSVELMDEDSLIKK